VSLAAGAEIGFQFVALAANVWTFRDRRAFGFEAVNYAPDAVKMREHLRDRAAFDIRKHAEDCHAPNHSGNDAEGKQNEPAYSVAKEVSHGVPPVHSSSRAIPV
jgi:hypothetical protein